jgi:hypothetical protein
MLPGSLYRNASPGSLNIYSINQFWFQGGKVKKNFQRQLNRISELGTTAYGARAKCWIPINLQINNWCFDGLIRLTYKFKPDEKATPVFLVRRMKKEDAGCSYSDFDKFFLCKAPAILSPHKETWKEIEYLVLAKLQQQSRVSPEDFSDIWIRGDTEEGIRLSLELRDWYIMYQSFLSRRANKMRGMLHAPEN